MRRGEIGVLHARFLEHSVKSLLHALPYGITVGLDDHAAAHRRLLGKVGLDYQVVVPLRVVVGSLGEVFEFFCHGKKQ